MRNKEVKKVENLFQSLLTSKLYKFPRHREKLDVPQKHGVYVIYNLKGKVAHVGRTYRRKEGLRGRLKEHLQGNSSFGVNYLNGNGAKLRKGYKFRYLVVNSARKRALVEALAIGKLCPKHLGLGK